MDHAIESLKDYARATAAIAKDNHPANEITLGDLQVMISAINVMEIRHYGKRITTIEHFGIKK